jgi:DNA-binding response OmpR family regulator
MDELGRFFRQAVVGLIDELESTGHLWAATGNDAELRRLCHSIKGSGGSFGFPLISVLAAAAERAGAHELEEAVAMLIAELRTVAEAPTQRTILLVDDDPLITRLLEHRLSGPDRTVVVASDLRTARKLLLDQGFNMVILDLMLTDGDGRTLLHELGENVGRATIPTVILSASDSEDLKAECISAGAQAFITKPFDPDSFVHTVGSLLNAEPARLSERGNLVRAFDDLVRDGATPTVISALSESHGPGGRAPQGPDPEVLDVVEVTLRSTLGLGVAVARWSEAELALVATASADEIREALDRVRLRLRTMSHPRLPGALVSFSAGLVPGTGDSGLIALLSRARRLAAAAHARGGDRLVVESAGPANRRVLLAEDDMLTAALVVHRLEREGFKVEHFPRGDEAIEALATERFDMAVLDVQMPGADGFEVLTRIRAGAGDRIPVVMLTAVGSERDVVRGFEMGADDYILKPFSPAELTVRLKRFAPGTERW